MISGRPIKRSVTLKGHRTSVSLEPEFWAAFQQIAAEKPMSINALSAEVDELRDAGTGLATAIRLYVLRHFRDPR
jgi:predicted DNA-binding ribbon-helix-helix protein